MRLEVRGRTPTGQSLADDPVGACCVAVSRRYFGARISTITPLSNCGTSTRCRGATLLSMVIVYTHGVLLRRRFVGMDA
jgi:hypothetical protein